MKKTLSFIFILILVVSAFSTTITMAAGAVGKELEVLNSQIAVFEKSNPDINVKIIPLQNESDSRHDNYANWLAAKVKTPTIFMVDVVWPAEFAPFFVDLTNDKDYFNIDEFLPGTVKSNTVNGKLVGIPWFTDAGLLYYRKDLLEKYGYQPPKTWYELLTIAKNISDKENINGFVWQGKRYEGLVCDAMEYLHSFGAEVIDNGKVVLDEPDNLKKATQALWFMKGLIDEGVTPKGVTTYAEEESRRIFQNGDAVFMRNWPYAWSLANADDSVIKGKVGIMPLPMAPNGRHSATLGGWNLAINKYATDDEIMAAKKFIKFLTSYDQQIYKAVNSGQNPTLKAAYSDQKIKDANPFMVDLYNVFINAEPRPVTPVYSEVSDAIQRHVYDVLTGVKSARTALKELSEELRDIINY